MSVNQEYIEFKLDEPILVHCDGEGVWWKRNFKCWRFINGELKVVCFFGNGTSEENNGEDVTWDFWMKNDG